MDNTDTIDEHEILNLSDKIDLLYSYFYNLNKKDCITYDEIILGNIGLNDIKISLPNENKHQKKYDKYLSEILDGKFKLLNSNENQYIFKKYSSQFPITVKLSFYNNEKDITSLDSEINNDSLMSYLLSSLIIKNKTKHILLPIINIDAKIDDVSKIINDKSITSKISNGEITNKCCLQLREHFFKMVSLEEYIQSNPCSFKILLFQIIHTLAMIQHEYNGFRHNNLFVKNIYLYLKKDTDTLTEYIGFKNEDNPNFYIPNVGFDIKIGNFEKAIIPKYYGINNNNDVPIEKDLLIFIDDLMKYLKDEDKKKCVKELEEFTSLIKEGPIKLSDLLYSKYFKEFKNNSSKKDIKRSNKYEDINIINHEYLTGIKINLDSDNYSILGKQYKISNYNIMVSNIRHIKKYKSNDIQIKRYNNNNTTSNLNSRTINDENSEEVLLNRINQSGGSKDEVNPYKAERNNPSMTNEQRRIFTQRSAETVPPKEQPLLLEQKIYDTAKQAPQKPQYPPSFIPIYDPNGHVENQLLPYSNRMINQPPIQKIYNISLSNPLGDYTAINRIYEDVLPGAPYNFTSLTIFERKQIIDFIRNSILEHNDGEEMAIAGGSNSLLSFIKILEVNPYVSNKNAFTALARNFLLYRGGYPIRFQEKSKTIGLAKPSIGVNIRLYKMTVGEYRCRKINENINADDFNLWRELKYYDWVKNDIVSRKISPNFVMPILYKLDSNSKIDWNKLEGIKKDYMLSCVNNALIENDRKINDKHKMVKEELFINKNYGSLKHYLPSFISRVKRLGESPLGIKNPLDKINPEKLDLTDDCGHILVLLTESPNTSLLQWARTIYEKNGTVKKMISSGYHTPDVWRSVLFQLVYAFAVLQEKEVYINNMSLENNFFIKDIFSDANAVGSWIYKVNDVDFYVPNYGYVLQVDSYYTDIKIDESFTKSIIPFEQKYKIYSPLFKDYKSDVIKPLIFKQFKSMIDPMNFGDSFKLNGGVVPDESVLNLLKNMLNNPQTNIRDYLITFFGDYIHNRVGTLLTKNEKENINILTKPVFIKGKLMAYQKRYQEFEWVIYYEDSGLKKKILTTDGKTLEVFSNSLYSYPENEIILPESKRNMKFDDYHIYETYNLDN